MKPTERLQEIIDRADGIVFFGGAGVSTESGINDFRSDDGLYREKYPYPPETMLSRSFFMTHPEEFFAFYRDKLLCPDAQPNAAHIRLAELERAGRLGAVVTQNIDGLHQMAGSRSVLELHGSVHRNRCVGCGRGYGLDAILASSGVPTCGCGGTIKPEVVLYEEALDPRVLAAAVEQLAAAETLVVGGTSLVVYPAAGLVRMFGGDQLVLINREPTAYDHLATLVLHEPIGQALGAAVP